jgi:N6-L-threonylcarbamoyladenine synthase
MTVSECDAIAYTRGPGMYACLGVSAASAKALGAAYNKPVIGVHHMVCPALTP